MAYIGLRKPIFASARDDGTYDEPMALGKAISLEITTNFAEASLSADDGQAEYVKEFTNADVTLGTSTIPIAAMKPIFGHAAEVSGGAVVYNKDDQNSNVAMAVVAPEIIDDVRTFVAIFLPKVKFGDPSDSWETKGDSITFKTPSISGKASANDAGVWKETATFKTEQEAMTWIYGKFGYSIGTLQVQSAASETEVGKTKLTVMPEKGQSNSYFYKITEDETMPAYNEVCNVSTGWTSWDGTSEITAETGKKIVVAEVTTEGGTAKKAGSATVAAKAE